MYKKKVLMTASVASMIDQFNMPNIELLLRMGYEVHIACNFREGNTCDAQRIHKLKKNLYAMGVRFHQWDCPRRIGSWMVCIKAYRQICRLMKQHHFDFLHCQSPIGGVLARIAAHQAGITVIYTAHGFHFYQGSLIKDWMLYYPVEKLLSYWTDILITVNREDYRLACQYLNAGTVWRIPGVGIDVDRFSAAAENRYINRAVIRQKYGIPECALLLLSVGELNKGKNHQVIIKALAALHRKDVYCMICGQGALREKLRQCADRIGVGGQVCLPGYQEDMGPVFQSADLFVFPSLREGMPMALMEAMAAGLPCIVSDIRGCRELIGTGSWTVQKNGSRKDRETICRSGGIRICPQDERQLAEALAVMLADKEMMAACGCRNRERVKTCSIRLVQGKMVQIYQEAGHHTRRWKEGGTGAGNIRADGDL